MTKFSGITPNTSPALIDYLLGVTSGNVDMRVTIQNLVNLILKTSLLSNPYKFSTYASATTAIAATTQKIAFNTENYDTGNNFDNVTNFRFVAPVAGFYSFNAEAQIGSAGMGGTESGSIAIYKNGSMLIQSVYDVGSGAASKIVRPQIVKDLQLAANDYIEIFVLMGGVYRDVGGGSTNSAFDGKLFSIS